MFKRFAALFAVLIASFAISTSVSAKTNAFFGFLDWDAAAAQAAINNGERVAINIWADWCPNCTSQRRSLSDLIKSDPEAYGDVKVFAIEYDDPNRPAAVGSHPIPNSSARTTIIFFGGGQELAVYGGQSPFEMAEILM